MHINTKKWLKSFSKNTYMQNIKYLFLLKQKNCEKTIFFKLTKKLKNLDKITDR